MVTVTHQSSGTPTDTEAPRDTPLIDEHRRLGAKLIEFAGWRLPVWYTSVAQEHAAVREAAGLFDVGHMGVLELSGEGVERFLDAVTTGWASRLERGHGRYTFLLDHDGLPIDDIIIFRLVDDRFLAVVNAANAERVTRWLRDLAGGREPLSEEEPERRALGAVEIRDLRSDDAGENQRMLLALQGPASAEVLCELAGGEACPALDLKRFAITEAVLDGRPVMISRTGYTGEDVGFELFVHPEGAADLWCRILEVGGSRAVLPAGLAARDSLRVEVGLPLFGHELAGPHQITPMGAGYAPFVALDKPFFVGREGLLAREEKRDHRVARFCVDDEGARAIRGGDPIATARGEFAGWVTSCALVGSRQIGMAWVQQGAASEGAAVLIYPARQFERATDSRSAEELQPSDRLPIHVRATVLPRFER